MRRFVLFILTFTAIVILAVTLPRVDFSSGNVAAAQLPSNWHSGDCNDTGHHWGQWGDAQLCQMRRTVFAIPSDHLSLTTENGGIDVTGEDRTDVALEARVRVWAPTAAQATDLLNRIVIDTANGDIRDHGPHQSFFGRSGYSIDYTLHVPQHVAADLQTENGGIDLTRLNGQLHFATTNGGVHLDQLAGDVQGHTVNGGLNITLAGDRWQGEGLNASTTNGGIDLRMPDHYSAHLETATVNGGISVNFPITIQGEIKNRLDTNIGGGGPTIHAETVNGGVSIHRIDGSDEPTSD